MTNPAALKEALERLTRTCERRPSAAQGTDRTFVHLSSGLQCEITQDGWSMIADQPETMGGQNRGPDPGFFGRAALGTCAAQGYAFSFARRGLAFRSIDVEVEADSDIRGFLSISPDIPPGYQKVRCIVTVESDADEKDLIAAMDYADRHSPWLYDFTAALKVTRQVTVKPIS